jgi:hypothetical protein
VGLPELTNHESCGCKREGWQKSWLLGFLACWEGVRTEYESSTAFKFVVGNAGKGIAGADLFFFYWTSLPILDIGPWTWTRTVDFRS